MSSSWPILRLLCFLSLCLHEEKKSDVQIQSQLLFCLSRHAINQMFWMMVIFMILGASIWLDDVWYDSMSQLMLTLWCQGNVYPARRHNQRTRAYGFASLFEITAVIKLCYVLLLLLLLLFGCAPFLLKWMIWAHFECSGVMWGNIPSILPFITVDSRGIVLRILLSTTTCNSLTDLGWIKNWPSVPAAAQRTQALNKCHNTYNDYER